ncbi:MAG TPA: hypothetical protein VE573_06010 [Nitrososphaeraceae archaeon]|jgi:transposase-like protein|nr:hypothetical protein [Nitrososphaeraceae archaeon]
MFLSNTITLHCRLFTTRALVPRERAKREIRRLIVEQGLTNREICEHLSLPSRTLERWLHEIYHEDNRLLLRPSIEDLATQVNIFKQQLAKQRQQVLEGIANNT